MASSQVAWWRWYRSALTISWPLSSVSVFGWWCWSVSAVGWSRLVRFVSSADAAGLLGFPTPTRSLTMPESHPGCGAATVPGSYPEGSVSGPVGR